MRYFKYMQLLLLCYGFSVAQTVKIDSIPRFHGKCDEIIKKLSSYNIYTDTFEFEDSPHPFWLFHPWFSTTVDKAVSLLDKVFKLKNPVEE